MKGKIKKLLGWDDISNEDDLFAKGILDSFGVIVFIEKLEKEFDIRLKSEDLIPQNFRNVDSIAEIATRYIEKTN